MMTDAKNTVARTRWQEFFKATEEREPRAILLRTLELNPTPGRALELGCGCGNDTVALLAHGWEVRAIDAQAEAIERTIANAKAANLTAHLSAVVCPFEKLVVEPASFELIYAGFSLPFCERERFAEFWEMLRQGLKPGGMIAGQLFGDRDEWAHDPSQLAQVFLTPTDFDLLTQGLERRYFEEVAQEGVTATNQRKYWHVYHFILRRP